LKLKKKLKLIGNKILLNTIIDKKNKKELVIKIQIKKFDSDLVKLGKVKTNK